VVKHSGGYFYDCSKQELNAHAKNETLAKELWEASAKITGLNDSDI